MNSLNKRVVFYFSHSNVEELCRFSGLPQRKQLSYSIKQLLAREVC